MQAFDLSPAHVEQYQQQGLLHLPQAIDPVFVERLSQALMWSISEDKSCTHTLWVEAHAEKVPASFDSMLRSPAPQVFLEALGHPVVQSIASQIMGQGYFPSDGHAVLKHLGAESGVAWHRDLTHSRKGPSCMLGIYLDPSAEDDGALMVVPGSHLMPEGICKVKDLPSRAVPAQPGDLIVHDQMLAHNSYPMRQIPRRRVVYFTFHAPAQVLHDGHFDPELMALRQDLPALAAQAYDHARGLPHPPFDWPLPVEMAARLAHIQRRFFQPPPSEHCVDHFPFHSSMRPS